MRFILLTIVLALGVAQVVYADTITGDQSGFEVLEKGINNGADSATNMVADIVRVLGVILSFISLYMIFSNKGRENPGMRKTGVLLFVLGAIFAAGAGPTISNMFSTQILNESNDTVKEKWDNSWQQD